VLADNGREDEKKEKKKKGKRKEASARPTKCVRGG